MTFKYGFIAARAIDGRVRERGIYCSFGVFCFGNVLAHIWRAPDCKLYIVLHIGENFG